MQLEKKVALVHDYAITHLPDGRWKTYVKVGNIRKEIRCRNKEDLLNKVLKHYTGYEVNLENKTLDEIFYEWLDFKRTITESPNTILRHKQHFHKYLQGCELFSQTVSQVNYLDLRAFCNSIVKENNMSNKEWKNVKTILKGMFEYSMEKGYIESNPMNRVKITVKFRQVVRKTGESETFNEYEREHLIEYLTGLYEKTHDTAPLALYLNFYLGLRIGELASIRWSDIEDGHIHIVREEFYDQEKNKLSIVEHTKTSNDRFVPLVPKAIEILEVVKSTGHFEQDDFIFRRGGERLNTRQISYVLKKYAKDKGIVRKSSHKIRKTYASMLMSNGVPIDEIRKLLGHTDLDTTLEYLYNPLTQKSTMERIEGALS